MFRNRVFHIAKSAIRLALALLMAFIANSITPARADTSVCGPITSNTTWTSAGNVYTVTCLVQVMTGVKLTIEPGTRVCFNDGVSMRVDGELVATGVTFTSCNASPSKGKWGQIFFSATSVDAVFDSGGNYISGSKIQDSLVVWGGGGTGVKGSIVVEGASPFLDRNNILNSSTRGIYATGRSSSQKIVIARNAISQNNGGGIFASNGVLKNNAVSNNSGGDGAGIYVTNSLVNENEVTNNQGYSGAGIYATGSILNYNTVSGNSGGHSSAFNYQGGGIYSNGSDMTGNIVTGNSIGNNYDWTAIGGGIYAVGGTLRQNTVTGNVITWGTGKGGGIYSSLSTLDGNLVNSNSVIGHNSSGGGIYISGGSVSGNTVSGNTVTCSENETSYGGGIYAIGGTVTNNDISNNSAGGGNDSQGGGVYGSGNTVSNNTFSGNSANRGGAIYSLKGTVTNNTVTNNTTSFAGTIYMNEGTALVNTVQNNNAANGGGIYGYKATLTGNTAENNTANLGGGILSTDSTVRGNTLTGNTAQSDGGGIYAEGGTVTNNTITGNTAPAWGRGSGAYIANVTDFSYNKVTDNTSSGGTVGGVSVISGNPVFQYNNLYGNLPYDAEMVSTTDITATLNYWGLSICTAIPNQIYDGNDAPGRGKLTYAPSLYQPYPLAQLSAPANLTGVVNGSSVTLSWDPIPPIPNVGCRPEGAKISYLVYYDRDVSCAPYDGTGLSQGPSPIYVENTSISLSGLVDTNFYFAITARENYLGTYRESSYSNEYTTIPESTRVYLPIILK